MQLSVFTENTFIFLWIPCKNLVLRDTQNSTKENEFFKPFIVLTFRQIVFEVVGRLRSYTLQGAFFKIRNVII